jgi:hypothetical protein
VLAVTPRNNGLVPFRARLTAEFQSKLKETVEQVAREAGQDTFNLVSIAAQLSYPGHVPMAAIEQLSKGVKMRSS